MKKLFYIFVFILNLSPARASVEPSIIQDLSASKGQEQIDSFRQKYKDASINKDVQGLLALGVESLDYAIYGSILTNEYAEIGFDCLTKARLLGDPDIHFKAAQLAYIKAMLYYDGAQDEDTEAERSLILQESAYWLAEANYDLGISCLSSETFNCDVHLKKGAQPCSETAEQADNNKMAREYFRLAAEMGHQDAQYRYGHMCYNGLGGQQDRREGVKYYCQAIETGHIEARFKLAELKCCVSCDPMEVLEGIENLRELAMAGHGGAQKTLSRVLLDEKCTHINLEEGCYWLDHTARQGDRDSQYSLGKLFYKGNYVTPNPEAAFYWFEEAAKQGLPSACFKVANMCFIGDEVPINYEKALFYYKYYLELIDLYPENAASLKTEKKYAERRLGEIYRNGLGTQRSFHDAAYWFERYLRTDETKFSDSRRYPSNFLKHTLQKMKEKIDDGFQIPLYDNKSISLSNFRTLLKDHITYGKLQRMLPNLEGLKNLYEVYVKELDKSTTAVNLSPLQKGTHTYLMGLLKENGEANKQVPQDVLRFYIILESFRQKTGDLKDVQNSEAFDIFKNQFCPSIVNCTVGKADSLMRYFIKAVPAQVKALYMSTDSAGLEEHELIVQNYLKTSLRGILEEFLVDENFIHFIAGKGSETLDPSHQTAYLRSCLGHHLGLEKEYIFDELPYTIHQNLLNMTPTQMLEKFCVFVTPNALCQRVKDKIDETLEMQSAAAYYLPHFIKYLEGEENKFELSYVRDANLGEVEKYEITAEAAEALLVRNRLLHKIEEESEFPTT